MRPRHLIACTLGFLWLAMTGAAVSAAAPPPAGKPTYFGVFGIPPDKAHDWPFTVSRAGPEDMSQLQGAGLKGLVALTGSKKNYSDASGCFQLGMWKQALDRHDAAHIQSLVDQGVLLGLYAIDEPHDWPCGPSFEDIDAACAYAGQKWPALKCGVNAPPAWLKPGASKLTHVGFLFFQYSNKKGTPAEWLKEQLADASWFHGDIWLSIQLLQPRLSVSEFRNAGLTFCNARPAGLLMWKWSDEWFAQPGVSAAMREVATACGSTAALAGAASRGPHTP